MRHRVMILLHLVAEGRDDRAAFVDQHRTDRHLAALGRRPCLFKGDRHRLWNR